MTEEATARGPRRGGKGWRMAAGGALVGLLGACTPTPEQIYANMGLAAAIGDRKGFLEAFTPESQLLVESQISLTEAYGLKRENPVNLLVFPNVESVEEVGEGEVVLTVSRGSTQRPILFVKTEQGWRIDLKKLAKLWDPKGKKG